MRNTNVCDLEGNEKERYSEVVKDVCALVLTGEGYIDDCYVDVCFVTDDEMRELNRKYRQIDAATDVLSFRMDSVDPEKSMRLLGEIVISEQRAEAQAAAIGHTSEREVAFLCVHGMLHLVGHDHENDDEECLMYDKQKSYMEIVENEILSQDEIMRKAIKRARKLLGNSYAPYSGLRVASVAVTSDDIFFEGVNVENVSFGATSCAERNAIYAAVTKGRKDLKMIAVASSIEGMIYPCGICRQVMSEFLKPWARIVVTARDGRYTVYRLDELMPESFRRLRDRDGV